MSMINDKIMIDPGVLPDSLNWQHSLCGNPRQNPDIRTLFLDHNCRNSTDAYAQLATGNQLMQRSEGFIPLVPNGVNEFTLVLIVFSSV